MDDFLARLQENIPISPEIQMKLLISFGIIIVVWVIHRVALRLVWSRTDDVRIRYRMRKSSGYVAFVIALVLLITVWLEMFRSVGTFLGLFSAGLAIALRDLVSNVAGWAFIVWRRPFELGDRIQLGEHSGDVIDIRIFEFSLMEIGNWVDADQSTGRVVHVPNGKVLSDPLSNYSKGFKFIWNELPVLVTFESDWKKAKDILQNIATDLAGDLSGPAQERIKESARKYLIVFSKLTPTVYTSVQDSGVLLTIRYLTKPRQRRGTAQSIWESILVEFAEHPDIEFAYPTIRYFDNRMEGPEAHGGKSVISTAPKGENGPAEGQE